MANNTTLNTGTGGDIISDDQITTLNGTTIATGEKVQRVKAAFGAAGTATDVTPTAPLPSYHPATFLTGVFTAVDAVVAAPIGDGTLVTGTSTAGSYISMVVPEGHSAWLLLLTGYATGSVYSEASSDSTNGVNGNWVEIKGRRTGTAPGVESVGYVYTSNGYWRGNLGAFKYFRIRYLGTFTAGLNARVDSGASVGAVFLNSGLVASGSIIGKVGVDQTTDGTTNAVRLLAETTKIIGTVNVATAPTIAVTGTFFQATQPVSIAAAPTTPVTGTFFQATQPVSLATNTPTLQSGSITAVTQATAANLNATIVGAVTANAGTNLNTSALALDTSVNALLKPASTLAAVTTVSAVTAITNALPAGANILGKTGIDQTTDGTTNKVQAFQQVITKGTQGATGVTAQDLKDAGRNQTTYYTLIPVLTSATDTLQTLTGTKAGATVAATATPAVVTTGKTFRVTRVTATYVATAVSGYGIVRLRFNTAGVVAITSPIAATFAIGSGTPGTANATGTANTIDEGWEFASGTGVGISVQGFSGVTPTAVGYVMVATIGYEY
jgi:hypothetical protein